MGSGAVILTIIVVFGTIALATVALRVGFRFLTTRLEASDFCLLASLVSAIVQNAVNAVQHQSALPGLRFDSMTPRKLDYVNQIFFKTTTGFSKLSICLVYTTLFSTASTRIIKFSRRFNYALTVFIIGIYLPSFFISIFQCRPISKAWLPEDDGTCINMKHFRQSTAGFNVSTSLLLIATPVPALMMMREKCPEIRHLLILILLGLVHTTITLLRLVILVNRGHNPGDGPHWWDILPTSLALVEMNLSVVVASLVVMRPAFMWLGCNLRLIGSLVCGLCRMCCGRDGPKSGTAGTSYAVAPGHATSPHNRDSKSFWHRDEPVEMHRPSRRRSSLWIDEDSTTIGSRSANSIYSIHEHQNHHSHHSAFSNTDPEKVQLSPTAASFANTPISRHVSNSSIRSCRSVDKPLPPIDKPLPVTPMPHASEFAPPEPSFRSTARSTATFDSPYPSGIVDDYMGTTEGEEHSENGLLQQSASLQSLSTMQRPHSTLNRLSQTTTAAPSSARSSYYQEGGEGMPAQGMF